MARKHLIRKAIHVKHGWYYEEAAGFAVVNHYPADIIVIPWSKILASVRRYKKPAERKAKP